MGELVVQKPVKVAVSIIFKEEEKLNLAEKRLKKLLGPLEPLERLLNFDKTDYYYEEFGSPLKRKLLCFKNLLPIKNSADIKLATNTIEDLFREEGKRTVNIDPGYVTEAKLVLLTTKDFTHRVYVGKNIFAESTLFFREGGFNSWPWTYPDYASDELKDYFNGVRDIYMRDIKKKPRREE